MTLSNGILGNLALVAPDFNGDGRSDLALRSGGSSPLNIFLAGPTSSVATVAGIPPVGTGIHLIEATYPGSVIVLSPSLSNTVGLQAEPVRTTFALVATPAAGLNQQPFTLTATLNPSTAQNHSASGTVAFSNAGVSMGSSAHGAVDRTKVIVDTCTLGRLPLRKPNLTLDERNALFSPIDEPLPGRPPGCSKNPGRQVSAIY